MRDYGVSHRISQRHSLKPWVNLDGRKDEEGDERTDKAGIKHSVPEQSVRLQAASAPASLFQRFEKAKSQEMHEWSSTGANAGRVAVTELLLMPMPSPSPRGSQDVVKDGLYFRLWGRWRGLLHLRVRSHEEAIKAQFVQHILYL